MTKKSNLIYDEVGQFPDIEKLHAVCKESPGPSGSFFFMTFDAPWIADWIKEIINEDSQPPSLSS